MTVFVSLRQTTIHAHTFAATDDGRAFDTVAIRDESGNDATFSISAESAATALVLADAIRAAALAYLPATQNAEVPA